MTRADRRRDQAALLAEYQRQQGARQDDPYDAPPPRSSPRYCPQSRDGEHYWSRPTNGTRRCLSCGATKDAEGRVRSVTGELVDRRHR